MKEKPLDSILNQEEVKEHVSENFLDQIELLRDMTNYGTNLIVRAFTSSKKELTDIIICGVLLKQVVAMIDAIQILVEKGMITAAFLPARAAFEASIYIDWILLSDSERKARSYIVANYRDERLWASRVIKGMPEEKTFDALSKSVGLDIHAVQPNLAAEAQNHLNEVNQILSQQGFKEIDLEFDQMKGKRKIDPEWYRLNGAKSIRQVAEAIGRLPEYEFFYSKGSKITHTASYKDHVLFKKNKQVFLKPIRILEEIDTLIRSIVIIGMRSYQNILKHYRAGELTAFSKKYANDWRAPFLSIKSIKYNF